MADWFSGVVRLPAKWLPRRAVSEPGDDPEWQRIPGPSFPFMIDGRQLKAALRGAGAAERRAEPSGDAAGMGNREQSEVPRDTSALRLKAKAWLGEFVANGRHRDRDSTLEVMRAAHPGLGVRGSHAVWREYTEVNPHLHLSRPGAKLKRNADN
ncbi:MAG: hypothetical protein ACREFP_24490 [Acetobacteraceae bacterium]